MYSGCIQSCRADVSEPDRSVGPAEPTPTLWFIAVFGDPATKIREREPPHTPLTFTSMDLLIKGLKATLEKVEKADLSSSGGS